MIAAVRKFTSAAVISLVSVGAVSGAVFSLSSHSAPGSVHATMVQPVPDASVTSTQTLSDGNTVWE
jgi:hypothetical protein